MSENAPATGAQSFETSSATDDGSTETLPNFPKVAIKRLENDLNVEFNSLKSGYDTSKTRRMDLWKQYRFQAYGNERAGQSAIVDSTIYNTIEWMLPVLIQPFIETNDLVKINPTSADVKSIISAEVIRELLSYQIRRRMPFYQILHDLIKGFLVQGESYAKVIWVEKDEKNDEPVGRPEVKAVPSSQIRYDWTVQNFLSSHVVTQEEDLSRSEILKMMKGKPGLLTKVFETQLDPPGRNMKEGRLRDEQQNQKNWVGEDDTKSSKALSLYNRREHWTIYDMDGTGIAIPIMAVFINDVLVQVIKNPYDFQRPPFFAGQDVRDPLGNPAFGHAEILSDIQKYRTAILRMTSDNLNSQHNGMYEMDMNNMDDLGRILLENAPAGSKVGIPVRKPGSIVPLQPAPIASHAFTAWEMMAEAGENRSGYTRYSQGLDSKSLNQTATGITQIMQRSDMRMWEIAQRFAEMCLKPMVRMVISLNQQKLDEQSLQLQFGVQSIPDLGFEGFNPGSWLTLSKKDIGGFFNVEIDVDVGSDRQSRIDNLLNYMQFVAPFVGQGVPPEVISAVAVELAKAMNLPKVQAIMRDSYVGQAGVSVPANLFSGSGQGEVGGSQGAVGAPQAGAGVQGPDLGGVLGELAPG